MEPHLHPFDVALVAARLHCLGSPSFWSCGVYSTLVLADFVVSALDGRLVTLHAAYARARGQAHEVN